MRCVEIAHLLVARLMPGGEAPPPGGEASGGLCDMELDIVDLTPAPKDVNENCVTVTEDAHTGAIIKVELDVFRCVTDSCRAAGLLIRVECGLGCLFEQLTDEWPGAVWLWSWGAVSVAASDCWLASVAEIPPIHLFWRGRHKGVSGWVVAALCKW